MAYKVKMKYELVEITNENELSRWDEIVDASPQGTIFHKNSFLKNIGQKSRYFFVSKGDQIKAGFVVQIANGDENASVYHSLVIHNGFFLKKDFVDSQELSRMNAAQFELMEFGITELSKIFHQLSLRLSPQVNDIRPLLWLNYHEPEKPSLKVNIRYTSLLDISEINSEINLADNRSFKALSSSRRQEIRYAIKEKALVQDSNDIKLFLSLYFEMAQKYDSNAESSTLEMEKLIQSLLDQNKAKLYFCRSHQGDVEAAAAFAWDEKRAYYLYGVTSKKSRNSFSGSYILWEAFKDLQQRGLQEVDLEGINSPNRGWFKMSFGGNTIPYFELSY